MSVRFGTPPRAGVPAFRKSSYCGSMNCVEVAAADGDILVRDTKDQNGPVLRFTTQEWSDFVTGVAAGEFSPHALNAPR